MMIAAVEDALSEAVVRRIVAVVRPDLKLYSVMRKNGHGYIRSRIRELNRTAQTIPVLVLVDLDRPEPCPADLIESFLPAPRASKLLFRVAVMEIESWVMADRPAFAKFLSVSLNRVPENPDTVLRPKEAIVSIAKRSARKAIRDDMVPSPGGTRMVGPAFNARLIRFVETWDPEAAARVSPSLQKAIERLRSAFREHPSAPQQGLTSE
ncbi:MAG: hypothetical protein JWN02_1608 [Acidobacteria bacterium]|nr:hypothetical protein [Acidobacteriota bacterium]